MKHIFKDNFNYSDFCVSELFTVQRNRDKCSSTVFDLQQKFLYVRILMNPLLSLS